MSGQHLEKHSPLLCLEGIVKTFPGVRALDGAGINVYPGRVMALLGENGAGKSTLMKIITGIYSRDEGQMHYLGEPVRFDGPRASQEAGISIIHQELNLIPELSIMENIFLGREPAGLMGRIQWGRLRDQAMHLLTRLRVQHDPAEKVGNLSVGQQQMVEIAKALSFESRVIIMDEPTDALTDTETMALFDLIRELKAEGRGIVYISHRLKEILEICDDATVFRDGQFVAEKPVADLTEDRIIELMVGRQLTEQYPRVDNEIGDVVLSLENVSGPGVSDVSLDLRAGEILGVSGLMGAGRTELMRIIYGVSPKYTGRMTLGGKPYNPRHSGSALKAGVAYISEDRKGDGLVLMLSVKHNMTLSSLKQFTHLAGRIQRIQERAAVNEFIGSFRIKTPGMGQEIGNLSGGNQQKVAIAKGLLNSPRVLILDEPTRGVDVGAKREIYELINRFKARGMSILLVSSEMPEVMGMSDRIMVMHNGQVTGEFSRAEATEEKLMTAAFGQTAEEEGIPS